MVPVGAGMARGGVVRTAAGVGVDEGTESRVRRSPAEPEIRWVGEQHLMHGYCGRASVPANDAGVAMVANAGGARAHTAGPMGLIESMRHRVVRIGPRPAGMPVEPAGCRDGQTEGLRETQARAA